MSESVSSSSSRMTLDLAMALINFDSQKAKKSLKDLIMNTGIPFGPVDFLGSSLSINFLISSGFVGERKKVVPSGLIINFPFVDLLYS